MTILIKPIPSPFSPTIVNHVVKLFFEMISFVRLETMLLNVDFVLFTLHRFNSVIEMMQDDVNIAMSKIQNNIQTQRRNNFHRGSSK